MSVPEQSLITEQHRATIGQKSDPVKVVITGAFAELKGLNA